MKRITLATTLVISLAGCVSWPPHGHSGAAEIIRAPASHSALRDRLAMAQNKITILRTEGAVERLPAAMETARVQWYRALRAAEGGFTKSANNDLERLEKMLVDLRSTMRANPSDTGDLVVHQRVKVLP